MKDIKLTSITNGIMNYKVFDIDNGFRVETYYDRSDSCYHAYISHKDYGIKDYMFGTPILSGEDPTEDDESLFLALVERNLSEYIESYYEDRMDCSDEMDTYIQDLCNYYIVRDTHDDHDFGDWRDTLAEAEELARMEISNMKKNGLDCSGIAIFVEPVTNDDGWCIWSYDGDEN